MLFAWTLAFGGAADVAPAPPHNVHVTHAEIGVDGRYVAARIRYFKHDLEDAIARQRKVGEVVLRPEPSSDSLFVGYLDSTFVLSSGGARLHARVVGSGEEKETEMWWYEVLYESPDEISALEIENRLLLELFNDQKNIVKAKHLTTGVQRSFYFARRVTAATFRWD